MRRVLPLIAVAMAIAVLPSLAMAQEAKDPPRRGLGPEGFFKRLDANKDGQISLKELPEGMRERFPNLLERADKDGDGQLSFEELKAARGVFRPHGMRGPEGPGKHKGPDGPRFGAHGPGGPALGGPGSDKGRPMARRGKPAGRGPAPCDRKRPGVEGKRGLPNPVEIFKRLDVNGDRQLSLNEFVAGVRRLHERIVKQGLGKHRPEVRMIGPRGPRPLAMRAGPRKPGPRRPAMPGRPLRHRPGVEGPNRLALFHLAQYHLAMYQFHGGKLPPGIHSQIVPGGPGPGIKAPQKRHGRGKPGPKHLAMRVGPPQMLPPVVPPLMKGRRGLGPGPMGCPCVKCPCVKCPCRKGPGPGGPHGPRVERVGWVLAVANRVFDRVDTNKDGKVDAEEAAEAHRQHFARVLARVDKDGDKAISKPEAKAALLGLIKKFHAARGGMKGPGECPTIRGKGPGERPVMKGEGHGKRPHKHRPHKDKD